MSIVFLLGIGLLAEAPVPFAGVIGTDLHCAELWSLSSQMIKVLGRQARGVARPWSQGLAAPDEEEHAFSSDRLQGLG